jgi:hypothetical protein
LILAQSFLFAVLCCSQQTPAAGPNAAPASDAGWRDLNRVAQIVNEEMLTSRAIVHSIVRENQRRHFANEGEAQEAETQFRLDHVKAALAVQAGQDLGLEPAQVDRRVKDYLERMKEELQGSAGMAAYLKNKDMTLLEEQDQDRDMLYARFWSNYVTGEGPVGDARQSRDRFVSPSYMRYSYRQCLEHPERLREIGGKGQEVVLQQLDIDPQSAGGPEQGRALAEELRRRIVDGEDMGDLVERYGAMKNRRGMNEPLEESRLRRFDSAVGAFLVEAKPGDVSDVMEYKRKDSMRFRIWRLVERTTAVVPDLTVFVVQKRLADRIQKDLSDWRREQAYGVLSRASYVWPEGLLPR